MSFFNNLSDWANERPGQALGAFLGFVIGLLILIFGPMKTVLVIILAAVGFIIGRLKDEQVSIIDELKGILNRKKRDR